MVEVPQVQKIEIEDQELAPGRIDVDRTLKSIGGLNAGPNPPSTDPNDLINFQTWMDTSQTPPELKFWDGVNNEWIVILFGSPFGGLTPPGVMLAYGGSIAPAGWALCNGAEYDSTNQTYVSLFNAIGFAYNSGGETAGYFRVPDTQNRVIFGASNTRPAGTYSGSNIIILTTAHLPNHAHGVNQSPHAHGSSQAPHGHGVNQTPHTHLYTFFQGKTNSTGIELRQEKNVPPYELYGVQSYGTSSATAPISLTVTAPVVAIHGANIPISIAAAGSGSGFNSENANVACSHIIKL